MLAPGLGAPRAQPQSAQAPGSGPKEHESTSIQYLLKRPFERNKSSELKYPTAPASHRAGAFPERTEPPVEAPAEDTACFSFGPTSLAPGSPEKGQQHGLGQPTLLVRAWGGPGASHPEQVLPQGSRPGVAGPRSSSELGSKCWYILQFSEAKTVRETNRRPPWQFSRTVV